ncbi:hypothetical protein D3C86_1200930 [compost metagenome]
MPGIFDALGQLRVMKQCAQGGQGWRLDANRCARALLIAITATFAVLVPGLFVPLLATSTGLLGRPLLLRHIHVLCLRLMVVAVVRHCVVIDARIVGRRRFLRCALCQLTDGFAAQAGDFGQALTHQNTQVGARHFVDQWCGEGGHVGLAFERARIGFFGQLLEEIIRQWLSMLIDPGLEGVSAFGAHQGIRVFAFGQKQKARPAAVLQA